MANKRIKKETQVFILAALSEGTPINATCRMFGVSKNAVLRVIRETGEALGDYMDKNFRDLPCKRIEMDEQWQYVGIHGKRIEKNEPTRGDFWLWACVDADTKLVFSHKIGSRRSSTGQGFVHDVRSRVTGNVQIASDNFRPYSFYVRQAFAGAEYTYGTEAKIFGDNHPRWDHSRDRKDGIAKIAQATRQAVVGSPDMATLTTCHIERVFLSIRQELKRFQRQGLGYSKDLEMHKLAVALHLGIYNLVRKHITLKTTPAVAACVEEKPWSLEDVVTMTADYMRRKEDEKFEAAFAQLEKP